ncbi:uroporphyrinogen-III C-methyltransferase [Ideonella sp.]|uniref:uroporphyrinogen-III C-methyltransferase n=1 Tax=Ideonella sp. TaxID=1929293 RepID=UPI0035B01B97
MNAVEPVTSPESQPDSRPGMVYIVGAGPGPADLLSLRALDRLQRADVVVHDRLVGDDVMALVPAAALRVYAGKASGHHVMPQAQIHAVLIEHARAGRRVVRLKGGDPHVFGRGGEEVQALQAAGIAFEVVPGISAANGCAAAAGIPLTHRELANTCTFLPGHLADGSVELDWPALARPAQTLVFYMGVERIARIAEQLIAHGLPDNTPAAIVRDGTRDTEDVLATGLAALARLAPAHGPRPGLLIVGQTVRLSPHYRQADTADPSLRAAATPCAHHFSATERASFYRLVDARRDMRHFTVGGRVDDEVLQRLLTTAHRAPSVGLMQPWRYVRVVDAGLRARIATLVDQERAATAAELGDRADEFIRLKVDGVRECAELLVVALAPDDGTVFGRRTMPRDMALCSLACSVQNLWLAARAENLGMGWVSMFEPAALAKALGMPAGAEPMGILCLGPVDRFYDAPMLEIEGWRQGRPLSAMVFTDGAAWASATIAP